MAKASLTLPDGTTVVIDGSPEEINKIMGLHRPSDTEVSRKSTNKRKHKVPNPDEPQSGALNLTELVNQAKQSEDFELIEKNILDRSSLVDRILLPLYVANKHIKGHTSLTSGDIAKFLVQLGVHVAQPNVARTLSSTALKYVMGDKVRRKGQAVRYRLSRRGSQYMSAVIKGESDG